MSSPSGEFDASMSDDDEWDNDEWEEDDDWDNDDDWDDEEDEIPGRLLVSAEVPQWIDEQSAADVMAQVVRTLSDLHIAFGGRGLVLDDVVLRFNPTLGSGLKV